MTRGVDRQWVRELYSFAVRPDLTLHFGCPSTSPRSADGATAKLKFYEAGMISAGAQPRGSFRLFQGKVLDEYDRIVEEFGLEVVNAAKSITEQQRSVRDLIARHLLTNNVEAVDEQPA